MWRKAGYPLITRGVSETSEGIPNAVLDLSMIGSMNLLPPFGESPKITGKTILLNLN